MRASAASAAERAEVAHLGAEPALECGQINLRVVGQRDERVARTELDAREGRLWPLGHARLGVGKALGVEERGTWIDHAHPVADRPREPREDDRRVGGADQEESRCRRQRLHEDRHRSVRGGHLQDRRALAPNTAASAPRQARI